MITKYLTEISASFNPFARRAKSARVFLSMIPGEARRSMKIATTLLPRASVASPKIALKFKDGKELTVDLKDSGINELIDQVDRHSRALARKEDLAG